MKRHPLCSAGTAASSGQRRNTESCYTLVSNSKVARAHVWRDPTTEVQ